MALRNTRDAVATNFLHENILAQAGRLGPDWQAVLRSPSVSTALQRLNHFLQDRLDQGAHIYPGRPFRALEGLGPDDVNVVILGQDPYHGANQAQGLAFSVPDHCPCPPSLRNIFKELAREYGGPAKPAWHELSCWAQQGVLLLNTVLTVENARPASHARKGWEIVTDALIERVAGAPQPKVFMLWGAHAQSKQALIQKTGQASTLVLTSNHPSPLSAQRPPKPFIGCRHFSQANAWLTQHGRDEIDWLMARRTRSGAESGSALAPTNGAPSGAQQAL